MALPLEKKTRSGVSVEDVIDLEDDSKEVEEIHVECNRVQDHKSGHSEADETTAQVLHSIVAEVSKKTVQNEDKEQEQDKQPNASSKEVVHRSVQCEDTNERLSNHTIELSNKAVQCEEVQQNHSVAESTMFHSFANESVESSLENETTKITDFCSISTQTDICENIAERLQKEIREKALIISLKEEVIEKLNDALKLKTAEIEKMNASLLAFSQKPTNSSAEEPPTPVKPKLPRGRPSANSKKNIATVEKSSENAEKVSETEKKISEADKNIEKKVVDVVKPTVGRPKRSVGKKVESEAEPEVQQKAKRKEAEAVVTKVAKTSVETTGSRALRGRKREIVDTEKEVPTTKRVKMPLKEKRSLDKAQAVKAENNKQGKSYSLRSRK